MPLVSLYTKVQQQEHKKMKRKLEKNETTAEEWGEFLDNQIVVGRENWKRYMKHR